MNDAEREKLNIEIKRLAKIKEEADRLSETVVHIRKAIEQLSRYNYTGCRLLAIFSPTTPDGLLATTHDVVDANYDRIARLVRGVFINELKAIQVETEKRYEALK